MCKKYNVYTMAELTMQTMTMYNRINARWFGGELPKAVITFESGSKHKAYGWTFVQKMWKQGKEEKYAIMLASEIIRNIEQMMITLTHEMCHLYAMEKGIEDVSRGGYYHNKEFARIAEMAGLVVTKETQGAATRALTPEYKAWLEKECSIKEIRIGWNEPINASPARKGKPTGKEKPAEEGSGGAVKKSGYYVFRCPACRATVRTTKLERLIACAGEIGKMHDPEIMMAEN